MLSIIIGGLAVIIIIIISYLSFINIYDLRKDYDNKFLNVTDHINSTQFQEYQYDKIKNTKLNDINSQINTIKTNYLTKKDANNKLSTKELQIGNAVILDDDTLLKISASNLAATNANIRKNMNMNNLTANNASIKNLNIAGSLNTDKKINITNQGPLIERKYGSDHCGIGKFDNKTRVYTANSIALSIANPNNTFDDILSVNSDKSTQIKGPVKINHQLKNEFNKAGISVLAANSEIGTAIGGPDNWSYFPFTDGSTYIRPGRKNGEITLEANKINLQSKTVNVDNKLCIGSKCVDKNTFNTVSNDTKNLQQVCLGNSCIGASDISQYDTYKTNIKLFKNQVQTLQSQITDLQSKFDKAHIQGQTTQCEVSVWSDWGPCDKMCGTGTQTRNRTITRQGAACPVLTESQPCNTQACTQVQAQIQAQNCVATDWSNWSACSASCNGGQQTRTRTISKPATNGGVCPEVSKLLETQNCNTQACPTNCEVSNWSGWTACDKSCGTGQQTRTRSITKPAANGGSCPEASKLLETQTCNTQACSINCEVSNWSNWSSCSKSCGTGNQTRTRNIVKPAANGGACPEASKLLETQACNTQACSINCEVSNWSDWSSCSKSCGTGNQTRTRNIVKPAANGGACPEASKLLETQACNTQACPVNCQVSNWSGWTACSASCNGGNQTRTRTITKPAANGGACPEASKLLETQNCNTQVCPIDCDGAWSDWSSCPNSTGKKTRTFKINKPAIGGGKPCANKNGDIETQFCPIDCVGKWTVVGKCDPNTGLQNRKYSITTPAAYDGTKCPNTNGQTDQQSCLVDCIGKWGSFGNCDPNTGNKTRTYTVTTTAKNGGKECPYNNGQTDQQPCPVDCKYNEGQWSTGCVPSCGPGRQTKEPQIYQTAKNGGKACPNPEYRDCVGTTCDDSTGNLQGVWYILNLKSTGKAALRINSKNVIDRYSCCYPTANEAGDKLLNSVSSWTMQKVGPSKWKMNMLAAGTYLIRYDNDSFFMFDRNGKHVGYVKRSSSLTYDMLSTKDIIQF